MNNMVKKVSLVLLVVGSVLGASAANAGGCMISKDRKGCISNGCVSSNFPNRSCNSERETSIAGVTVKQNCNDKTDVRVVIHNGASESAQREADSLQEGLKNGANIALGDVISCTCEQQ